MMLLSNNYYDIIFLNDIISYCNVKWGQMKQLHQDLQISYFVLLIA